MKRLNYEFIVEQVQQRIISGEWKPGDRIPTLKQLSEEFEVSTISVREALRVLESKDIISIEHGRGMFVRRDPSEISNSGIRFEEMESVSLLNLLEARMLLEPELAALCAERGTPRQVRQIRHLAEVMKEQMENGGDFFTTDMQFHQTIAEGSGNPILAQMLMAISDLLIVSRRETNRLPNMKTKSSHFHTLIAIAIEERQSEQARMLMKAHLYDMESAVRTVERKS